MKSSVTTETRLVRSTPMNATADGAGRELADLGPEPAIVGCLETAIGPFDRHDSRAFVKSLAMMLPIVPLKPLRRAQ